MARGRRLPAILDAVVPTARCAHLGAAAATVVAASAPVIVALARGDVEITAPLIVLSLGCGAALGWSADDPAAELLGAMPVSSPLRAGLRIAAVTIVVAIGVACVLLAVQLAPGASPGIGLRVAEGGAAAAIALAVGFAATRRREPTAGAVGVIAGVVGTASIAALGVRWPEALPTFDPRPTHDRWWIITAIFVAILVRAGRDPGRR